MDVGTGTWLDGLDERELRYELVRRKEELSLAQSDLLAARGESIEASSALAAAKARSQKNSKLVALPSSVDNVKLQRERAQKGISDLTKACSENTTVKSGLDRHCEVLELQLKTIKSETSILSEQRQELSIARKEAAIADALRMMQSSCKMHARSEKAAGQTLLTLCGGLLLLADPEATVPGETLSASALDELRLGIEMVHEQRALRRTSSSVLDPSIETLLTSVIAGDTDAESNVHGILQEFESPPPFF